MLLRKGSHATGRGHSKRRSMYQINPVCSSCVWSVDQHICEFIACTYASAQENCENNAFCETNALLCHLYIAVASLSGQSPFPSVPLACQSTPAIGNSPLPMPTPVSLSMTTTALFPSACRLRYPSVAVPVGWSNGTDGSAPEEHDGRDSLAAAPSTTSGNCIRFVGVNLWAGRWRGDSGGAEIQREGAKGKSGCAAAGIRNPENPCATALALPNDGS